MVVKDLTDLLKRPHKVYQLFSFGGSSMTNSVLPICMIAIIKKKKIWKKSFQIHFILYMVIYFHYIIPGNEVVIFQPLKLVKVQFKRRSTQPIAIWSTQISFWPYLPTYLIMHYGHFCQLSNLTTLLLYNYRLHCSAATCRYHNSQRH